MRTGTSAALTATLALALAGCGGSGGGLSKSDLDAKVNAICTTENAKQAKIKVPPDFATNPVSAANYLEALQSNVEDTTGQLKKLKPGKDVKADYNSYLSDIDHALGLLKSALDKAKAKDRSGLQDVQSLGNYLTNTVHPLEKRLGFTACASSG